MFVLSLTYPEPSLNWGHRPICPKDSYSSSLKRPVAGDNSQDHEFFL